MAGGGIRECHICVRPPPVRGWSQAARIRRYGSRIDRGRDGVSTTDRGVAHFQRTAYVAGMFIAGTFGGPAFRVPAVSGGALMTASTHSTALAPIQPSFTDAERLALAGFLAGYRGLTREAYTSTCGSSLAGAGHGPCRCSRSAAPTLRPSPANWKPAAAPGPPSPGGCAPSPGSTSTPSKKNSSSTRPPRTSAVPGWIMSHTSPPWTATSSAPSSSPPGSARPPSTP